MPRVKRVAGGFACGRVRCLPRGERWRFAWIVSTLRGGQRGEHHPREGAWTLQRKTTQREVIRDVMKSTPRPLSAQEVLDAAQMQLPRLGIATVYRTLKALTESGWLTSVELPGEASRYERANQAHHHHFHCSECGRVFDVPGCSHGVEALAPDGFDVERHEILLYGTCQDCNTACA